MLYSLKGTLTQPEPGSLVVDCGGVSYLCQISLSTAGALQTATEGTVYTYLAVREDSVDLFGFSDLAEKQCFLALIGVSGVGPKAALSILSAMTPDDFVAAVLSGDAKAIATAKGVGPKLAMRVVLELKDKLAKSQLSLPSTSASSPFFAGGSLPSNEALDALLALGFARGEAEAALGKVLASNPPAEVEEQIRLALGLLSR